MTTETRRKSRYFYGWNIVGTSILARLAYAETHSSMLGFFFKPLQREFGWSRSAIAAVQTISRIVESLFSPVVGPFVDRYGARVLMPIGAIIVGFSMLAITQINTLWQFYLLRGVTVALGLTLIGNLVIDVTINNWFTQKRGRAIAIGRIGNSLSNIIFIPITVFIIATSGWRTMFVIFAIVTWLVVLIPSLIIMRRRPEDMGLHPDGMNPNAIKGENPQEKEQISSEREASLILQPVWNRREVLTTGVFWLLTTCFAINNTAFQGINISLAPYIQDLGYTDAALAAVMTFRAASMAVVLPLMGFAAEHTHRRLIRAVPFVLQGIGTFLFLLAEKPVFLWLAVVTYGLGFSGVGVIQEVIWANFFGRLSLGLVRSLGYLITFGFGAIGPIAMNAVFDILGSYWLAFVMITFFLSIAAFLITTARPPKPRRYATAAEIASLSSR